MAESKLFFYLYNAPPRDHGHVLPSGYRWMIWRPTMAEVSPAGLPVTPFGIWWLFHILRIFCNRDYGIFVIYKDDLLVHRSVISPKYFRFPFMSDADLQIGDTWTHANERGKGLASFTLREITRSEWQPGRRFWYLVDAKNTPSIRAAETAGFHKFAYGAKLPRFGVQLLGFYAIQGEFAPLAPLKNDAERIPTTST